MAMSIDQSLLKTKMNSLDTPEICIHIGSYYLQFLQQSFYVCL